MQELARIAFVIISKSVNSIVLDSFYWILDRMPYCVRIYSMAGKLLFENKGFFYYDEPLTHRCKSVDAKFKLAIKDILHDDCSVLERMERGETDICFSKNGRNYRRELVYVLDPLHLQGESVGIVELISPQDALAEKNKSLWKTIFRSQHDLLSGLYNHDRFIEEATKFLARYSQEQLVFVIWDVIHFKVVNSIFGVQKGDQVLEKMGNKIKLLIKDKGVACRLIGDKFAFCLPETMLTKEWLHENAKIILTDGHGTYKFKTRLGICRVQSPAESVHLLLDRCMVALRSKTESSKESFAWYDPEMAKKIKEEHELLRDAEVAFEQGQFIPYLQPVYNVATGKVAAAEALARWIHPTKGVIPPDKFIPLFERNGMIFRLDLCIWNQVGAILAKQKELGEPSVPISINLSRVDFLNPYLIDEIDHIVEKNNLKPNQLNIEVTESAYMDQPDKIIKLVNILRTKGFCILLDDFGSGYSSLNILKDIPVDVLKIDIKFMAKFEEAEKAASIVASVVRMAHEIGLTVVTEGVETEEQARFLREIGCELIQ